MKPTAKPLPLDPPATEAELEYASQIWTAAQDVMVARGFGRHLWGNLHAASHEFTVLMLRAAITELRALREDLASEKATRNSLIEKGRGLEAQIREYKRVTSDMADKLREHGARDLSVRG